MAWLRCRRLALNDGGSVVGVVAAGAAMHLTALQVRDEVAAGRMVIPANRTHLGYLLQPMAIGRASKTKINANMGASPVSSGTDEEVEKLKWAEKWGAEVEAEAEVRDIVPLPGGQADGARYEVVYRSSSALWFKGEKRVRTRNVIAAAGALGRGPHPAQAVGMKGGAVRQRAFDAGGGHQNLIGLQLALAAGPHHAGFGFGQVV